MMNFNQALAILKKDEEEERNWRSARGKLTEVLLAAIDADATVQPVTKHKQALESDVAALRTAFATLDGDYQRLQAQYGQLEGEYRAKARALEATLSAKREQLAAIEQLIPETEARLASITKDWHLKTGQPAA